MSKKPIVLVSDFRMLTCPEDASVVVCDPPYGIGKKYGNEKEERDFCAHVEDVVKWSCAPRTFIFAPFHTMPEWLHRVPAPSRILIWCKTFAQIRKHVEWQHAVTPILMYARENATFYFPGGIVPDWIVCGSSMSDIRTIKHFFRGEHPGVTGTSIVTELLLSTTREDDLVVDPMCGIGSTLVAGLRLSRRVWGCEIVPEYAHAARAWLSHELVR